MQKPAQIREVITRCVPSLATNPDRLTITVGEGHIVATGAASLSFEWQYQLAIGVIDFAGHPNQLLVPLLAWLRANQSELFCNPDKRDNAIKVESELLGNDLYDLLITLPLTERVIVTRTEVGLGWAYAPEPQDSDDEVLWQPATAGSVG